MQTLQLLWLDALISVQMHGSAWVSLPDQLQSKSEPSCKLKYYNAGGARCPTVHLDPTVAMELTRSSRKPEMARRRRGGTSRRPQTVSQGQTRSREPRGLFTMEAATTFLAPEVRAPD